MKEITVLLAITLVLMAEQNNYSSINNRVKQEAKDSVKVHPKRDLGTKPHNLQQGLKNSLYGGSDTRGYILDSRGHEIEIGNW